MSDDLLQPKKRKRGRPPVGETTPIQVRMTAAPLARLDAWRRQQADLPTRPEAIRRLVEAALSAPPKSSSDSALAKKLAPLIKALKEEGKKNVATMSPGTVARLAALLERELGKG